ncbi:MAG: vitamin B12-dependent ribonucleotide reductase [bacterium]|nr:vitamin B12-dependent ribonucleotide reductase [bacterium]
MSLVETNTFSSANATPDPKAKGLRFERHLTQPGLDPYTQIEWEIRDARITGEKRTVVFEQKGVEIPKPWSQMATNVVVSKYFRGTLGTPEREHSVRQLIARVADTITAWGSRQAYFSTEEDQETFHQELTYLLLHQHASFNSPVWFNVGVEAHPQCSACFINSVEDTMESILDLAKTEGMLFKYGSGTGTNFSAIRSSKEKLHGGGTASGPVSFMKGYDAFAGVIKSGGKTRRAAKMVILNIDHPDIMKFIRSKSAEEKKAWALIDAGYDGSFNGEAYSSIFFQNANHSVRLTDEFMHAVQEDKEWSTRFVTTGEICDTYRARDIFREIAQCAHDCGDPGLQFHTTINQWHTCQASGDIHASNPCSEYMFLDDTACNLASLNLMKFLRENGEFDTDSFKHAIRILITAQEIIVDNASYPTARIGDNSHLYRTLGLGYANLGALLMANGLPYDSDEGRTYAACVTALLCGEAYAQSARLAAVQGTFERFEPNRDSMLRVIEKHTEAAQAIPEETAPAALRSEAIKCWKKALKLGNQNGFRNAQVTVLAPTGTIGFMMDCDTTGIEPDIALVKYKNLVGGGVLKIVNQTVPLALQKLGYSTDDLDQIIQSINEEDTIEKTPLLKPEHLPIFDCAFRPAKGKRSIDYMGHIKMMAVVQPFLSGAISKTVNMACDATVKDIENAYQEAWKRGLKAIAIYRDGSKRTQPLNTSRKEDAPKGKTAVAPPNKPYRRRLPDERHAITHKFSINGHEGYITVGLFPDGQPGEIFLTMAKEGSVVSGLMDGFATSLSLSLQYGVPLKVLVNKFVHTRFEPAGFTGNPQIPIAKSITDYIFRWLASKFLSQEDQEMVGILTQNKREELSVLSPLPIPNPLKNPEGGEEPQFAFEVQADAPPCHECGAIMVRNGACYKCMNCGATSGCS